MCQAVRRLAVAAGWRPATALALARGSWTAEMGYLYLQLFYKVQQLRCMPGQMNSQARSVLLLAAALLTGHRTCSIAYFLIAVLSVYVV